MTALGPGVSGRVGKGHLGDWRMRAGMGIEPGSADSGSGDSSTDKVGSVPKHRENT